MKFLTHASIIRCNHGGLVRFNQVQSSWQIDGHQVLTVDAVEDALIVDCQQKGLGQTPCSCVTEITRGKVLEAAVDGYIPLSENLNFRTDGIPEGEAVLVSNSPGSNFSKNFKRAMVAALVTVLIAGGILGGATIIRARENVAAEDNQMNRLQEENEYLKQLQEENEYLKQKQEENLKKIENLNEEIKFLDRINDQIESFDSSDDLRNELKNLARQKENYKAQAEGAASERNEWKRKYKRLEEDNARLAASLALAKRDTPNARSDWWWNPDFIRNQLNETGRQLEGCRRQLTECQNKKCAPTLSLQINPFGNIRSQLRNIENKKALKGEIKELKEECQKYFDNLQRNAEAKLKQMGQQ